MSRINFRGYFINQPIKVKLNLVFLSLGIIPLLAVGIVSSYIIGNILRGQHEGRSRQYVGQAIKAVDMSLSEIDSILMSGLRDQGLRGILSAGAQKGGFSVENSEYASEILREITNARKDIKSILLKDGSGNVYTYSLDIPKPEIFAQSEYALLRANGEKGLQRGEIVWLGHPDYPDLIMGVRKVIDPSDMRPVGDVVIVTADSAVTKQFEQLISTANSFFVIRDRYGGHMSDNCGLGLDLKELEAVSGTTPPMAVIKTAAGKLYATVGVSERTGWLISHYIPANDIFRNVFMMQLVVFSMVLVLMAALLALVNWFSAYFTAPIYELRKNMQEVENENFTALADDNRKDEYGQLARSFNSMAGRLKVLIEEDYKSKILLRETQFKFLRAQINPHFLYNTLDSISWLAAMEGNTQVSEMSVALGGIMRWAISHGDMLVPMADEVANVRNYLTIQKMRYGENLEVSIHMPAGTGQIPVPKMILQPLVENALVHGLELQDGLKRLRITAGVHFGTLFAAVRDNGVGMSGERILEIMRPGYASVSDSHHGVGIGNVNERINMVYGERGKLTIKSRPHKGTVVTVILPLEGGEKSDG